LASYLERVQKSKDKADILTEEKLIELLKKNENEEIVRQLAAESAALSTSTEKGTFIILGDVNAVDFEPAYNLLIHLILTSSSAETLLPQVITNLSTPPSFPHGPSIAIAVLSTIFNIITEYPSLRFQVFKTILSISQRHKLYDYVSSYFKSINQWLDEWNVTEQERSQVWATIISMAEKADDRYVL
jgi:translation initiation factor 3 subunit M